MRISDWSSDVCSSDLLLAIGLLHLPELEDLAHDLDVEAAALGLGEDLADIRAERGLLLLQALDSLDEGTQTFARDAADIRHASTSYGMDFVRTSAVRTIPFLTGRRNRTQCFCAASHFAFCSGEIGRAHVCTPVTNAHL